VIFEFPLNDARVFPIHVSLLGHEFFHVKVRSNNLIEQLLDYDELQIPVDSLRALVTEQKVEVSVVNETNQVLSNWLTEIVADLASIHCFGPAALFSYLYDAMSRYPLEHTQLSHPDALLRIRLMIEELEHLGYQSLERINPKDSVDKTSKLREAISEWKTAVDKDPQLASDIHGVVREHLTNPACLDIIRNTVRKIDFDNTYNVEAYVTEVPELAISLTNAIPPGEIWNALSESLIPATIPGIYNAAFETWMHNRDEFSALFREEDRTEGKLLATLSRLTLKAVEGRDFYDISPKYKLAK